MAEHEWEKGDAVWELPKCVPTHIRECDWMVRQARVDDIYTDRLDGGWVSYDSLRPRDPALGGADIPTVEPTAESEAKR